MADKIIRTRLRGRKVDSRLHWRGWHAKHHTGHERHKMKRKTDKRIPAGYQHTGLEKVPLNHYSDKAMQDSMEDAMVREIRHTPPGERRDFLMKDYEAWVANNRPVYGHFDPHLKIDGLKKNDVRRTHQAGTPVYMDFKDDGEPRRLRRYLKKRGRTDGDLDDKRYGEGVG